MKILYLTTSGEDYLQDSVLLGLRKLLAADLVDYPKKDVMYKSFDKPSSELYGMGFTLWKLLEDIDIDRTEIDAKIESRYFDLIIFGSIWRQQHFVTEFIEKGYFSSDNRIAFLDGEDHHHLPRTMYPLCLLAPYYKRERVWSSALLTRQISFSIPSEKVRIEALPKEFLFAKHVQCDEAYKIDWIKQHCQSKYAFSDENAYYENLSKSWYAVTMRKAGWDCMRHYEIAANGTVMAFYRLKDKSYWSAPYNLVDMENVVAFDTAEELMQKLEHIEQNGLYPELQRKTFNWAQEHMCEQMARNLLVDLDLPMSNG